MEKRMSATGTTSLTADSPFKMHGLPYYGEQQKGTSALAKTTSRFTPIQEKSYNENTSSVHKQATVRFERDMKNSRDLKKRENQQHYDKIVEDRRLMSEQKLKLKNQKKDLGEYLQF